VVEHPECDVCSRTLLKGEELHEYASSQGERFGVCVLCRSRAEAEGWIPAEEYREIAQQPAAPSRRGQALRKRLAGIASRARSARRGDPEEQPKPAEGREPDAAPPAEPEPPSAPPAARPEAPPHQEGPLEAARPRPVRRQAPRPARRQPAQQAAGQQAPQPRRGPEAIMRRAVECFNSSDEPRKVAGLIRSLGEPRAAIRPDPPRQLALVTVAWELSWYQWEVSANGDEESVREVAKGSEVSELAEGARAWNASVAEDGMLRLRAADKRPEPSTTEA
jgi:hypothetical protein